MEAQRKPLTEIVVRDRQRKEYPLEKIKERADSIQRTKGLLQPAVLDPRDNSLIAGRCRMMAYGLLFARAEEDRKAGRYVPEDNWASIPFVYKGVEGGDEEEIALQAKICELEENISRLDLEWWERAAANADIDDTYRKLAEKRGETWSLRKSAELAGVSLGTMQQSVALVREAKENPDIVKEETLVGALRKVDTKKKLAERAAAIEEKSQGKVRTYEAEILTGDARLLIDAEPADEYDCITTNFPFGVEYGYSGQAEKLYDDDEAYIVDLVREVVKKSYRVLKDDSWFFGFFDIRKCTYSNPMAAFFQRVKILAGEATNINLGQGNKFVTPTEYNELIEMGHKAMGLAHWFEEAGFKYVRMMPIIWAKPNKTQGNIGDPRKGMIVAYEAAILACKGDGVLLKQGRNDLFVFDTLNPSERDFGMQMPVAMCKEIISLLTLGKGRVLDPFAGVGSFGEGALENQCSFRGFELNPERAATGNLRLKEHILARVSE
jgi:hypothetical protein